MTPVEKRISLSEIRRRLDPCCSYVILEFEADEEAAETLLRERGGLPLAEADIAASWLYQEADSGRMLLVVRLVPEREEEVRDRILASRIPRNATLHYYGRDAGGRRHTAERL
jgi:hypothetical protein